MQSPRSYRSVDAPNQFVEVNGRTLAYRSIGSGKAIILCARFRGNMDVWDPAFLDALADNGMRVITFDYSGLGLSTGTLTYDLNSLAQDAKDLADALDLDVPVISGWSLGGMAAQVALAKFPGRFSHAVIIGSVPPGQSVKPSEQLFYDTAGIPNYSFENEVVLFFEPKSEESRLAARKSVDRIALRQESRSKPVPLEFAVNHLGEEPRDPIFPAFELLEFLKRSPVPLLHVGGDHDIIFPVENWYALNQVLPTAQVITFPNSGHGPQHQHPEAAAAYIATFVRTTK